MRSGGAHGGALCLGALPVGQTLLLNGLLLLCGDRNAFIWRNYPEKDSIQYFPKGLTTGSLRQEDFCQNSPF